VSDQGSIHSEEWGPSISINDITARDIHNTILEYIRICEENCPDLDPHDASLFYLHDLCDEFKSNDEYFLRVINDLKIIPFNSVGDITHYEARTIFEFIYEVLNRMLSSKKIFKNGSFVRIIFDNPRVMLNTLKNVIVRHDNPNFDVNNHGQTEEAYETHRQNYENLKNITQLKLEALDHAYFEAFDAHDDDDDDESFGAFGPPFGPSLQLQLDEIMQHPLSVASSSNSNAETLSNSGYFSGSSNYRTVQRPYNRIPLSNSSVVSELSLPSSLESFGSLTTEVGRDSMSSLSSNEYGGKMTKRRKKRSIKTSKRKQKGEKTKRKKQIKRRRTHKKCKFY
jgi:hypothetical protein